MAPAAADIQKADRQLIAALAALWEAQQAVVERLGPFERWSKSDLARWAGAAAIMVSAMPECLLNARPELFGQMVAGVRCLIADGTEEESLKILNTVLLKGARSSTPQAGHLAVAALRDGLVADALELPGRLLASGVRLSGSTASESAASPMKQQMEQAAGRVWALDTSGPSRMPPEQLLATLRQSLPAAVAAAELLRQHWAAQEEQAEVPARVQVAQAVVTRSCAYLGCANLGAQGGPAAGEGVGSLRCSGCRVAWYCGTACSHADWQRGGHKHVCKALAAARAAARAAAQGTAM
ncbi:hypothetical protein CHLNCDRAFT_136779 [Chlorella variabilis]|uniref:MYND-type domain-containing protein n=1 Tax=Chlorella variabilis TaxID=554065 RepID=E1ZL21_CHLVA|nr:hypothetical protein CHLNCDRAFT_136779 [Chlorella variabilis]EFN53486.1 hypothetical protein CHLNCDRAFT_136779 [Chlorella variabilis]|eukprot:XP_005845588.1 hypothetical protein CHLNCDRAFT_136779 [Chlorella variabilis]